MGAMTSEEYHNLGEAYSDAQQWPQALEAFQAGLELDRDKPVAAYWLYSMGYCYKKMQQLAKAEECFKQAIQINPNNLESYEELTRMYSYQQRYAEALEMAEEANRINPNSPEVLRALAIAYDGVGRNEESCEIGRQIISLEPDNPSNYINLGVSQSILHRYLEALANLQKAVSIDPSYARARYNLGCHYLRTGKFDEASEEWKALNSIDEEYALQLKVEFTKVTGLSPNERIEAQQVAPLSSSPSQSPSRSAPANTGCGGKTASLLVAVVACLLLMGLFFNMKSSVRPPTLSVHTTSTSVVTPPALHTSNPALDEYVALTSQRKLTNDDLIGLSKSDLAVMRNAPYARHHYKFDNAPLYNYFSRQPWYVPKSKDAEHIYDTFSPVERANVNFILNYQNKHGLR